MQDLTSLWALSLFRNSAQLTNKVRRLNLALIHNPLHAIWSLKDVQFFSTEAFKQDRLVDVFVNAVFCSLDG